MAWRRSTSLCGKESQGVPCSFPKTETDNKPQKLSAQPQASGPAVVIPLQRLFLLIQLFEVTALSVCLTLSGSASRRRPLPVKVPSYLGMSWAIQLEDHRVTSQHACDAQKWGSTHNTDVQVWIQPRLPASGLFAHWMQFRQVISKPSDFWILRTPHWVCSWKDNKSWTQKTSKLWLTLLPDTHGSHLRHGQSYEAVTSHVCERKRRAYSKSHPHNVYSVGFFFFFLFYVTELRWICQSFGRVLTVFHWVL